MEAGERNTKIVELQEQLDKLDIDYIEIKSDPLSSYAPEDILFKFHFRIPMILFRVCNEFGEDVMALKLDELSASFSMSNIAQNLRVNLEDIECKDLWSGSDDP